MCVFRVCVAVHSSPCTATSAASGTPRYWHGSSVRIVAQRGVWEENGSLQGKKRKKNKLEQKKKKIEENSP